MEHFAHHRPHSTSRGFALIEILVALVVLAIGLLGTLGLQLSTLRSNQFTAQAAVATQLASDYEEIVQMMPSAALSSSSGTNNLSALDTYLVGTTTVKDCKGVGTICTPDELANYMINDWKGRVMTELPAGRAIVCRDSAPRDISGAGEGLYHWACDDQGDLIMIKIGWAARADKTDQVMQAIATDNRPRIVITVFGNQSDFADLP